MIKAHKIRLNPTPEQAAYCAKAAGTARFVWNWALAEWNRHYEAGENPTFKSKKKSKPSFYLANDQFELGDHRIWIRHRSDGSI